MVWLRVMLRAAGKHAGVCIYLGDSNFRLIFVYFYELTTEYLCSAKNATQTLAII